MAHLFTTYRALIGSRVSSRDREAANFANHSHFAKTAHGTWLVWRDAMPGRLAVVFPDQLRDEELCSWLVAADTQHPIADTIAFADDAGLERLRQMPDAYDPLTGFRLYHSALALRIGVLAGGDLALESWMTIRVERAMRARARQLRAAAEKQIRERPRARRNFVLDPQVPVIVPSLTEVLALRADTWLVRAPRLALL